MKRTAPFLMVLFLAVLCGKAFAEVVVPLERTPLPPGPTAAFWASKYVDFTSGRAPAAGLKAPDIGGTAYYASVSLGGHATTMLLDVGAETKLYVDTDRDGDLAEEEPFTSKGGNSQSGGLLAALAGPSRTGSINFDSLTLTLKDPDATCEVALQSAGTSGRQLYVIMRPAVVRAGRAELGGKLRQVQVMDANFDGRYDSAFASDGLNRLSGYNWDVLFVDANGDGKLMRTSMSSGEVMPLPGIVSLGGSWYGVKVAPDGSSATFTPVEPSMGRLDVGTDQAELDLLSDSGFHHLTKSQGGWQLPAGSYQAMNLQLVDSVNETPWTMSASWPEGRLRGFSVQADQPTSIKLGPPLLSNLTFNGDSANQSIGFELKGRAGEAYAAGAARRGVMQPAPAFVILDENGKKLASGAFEYG